MKGRWLDRARGRLARDALSVYIGLPGAFREEHGLFLYFIDHYNGSFQNMKIFLFDSSLLVVKSSL